MWVLWITFRNYTNQRLNTDMVITQDNVHNVHPHTFTPQLHIKCERYSWANREESLTGGSDESLSLLQLDLQGFLKFLKRCWNLHDSCRQTQSSSESLRCCFSVRSPPFSPLHWGISLVNRPLEINAQPWAIFRETLLCVSRPWITHVFSAIEVLGGRFMGSVYFIC